MLTLDFEGHTLIAVPAIHHRVVFAELVHRACADLAHPPAAIAVELDPAGASTIAAWLRELGVAPGQNRMPCMLGLVRRNQRIHPRFKDAVLRLQKETGRPLRELPADLLQRELGYAPVGLVCLTPTDSIIEAIRCALELGLPLFGIDMDETPTPVESAPFHFRDPLAAREDLATFVRQLGIEAASVRDDYTDGRREQVMAARLKTLLRCYHRVLFTGGLGHWASLCRLLADEGLKPATQVPQDGPVSYQRVLVHPQQAIAQMDLFPAITAAYETARRPASLGSTGDAVLDPMAEFQGCLDRAFRRYAEASASNADPDREGEGAHGLFAYTPYLLNLCLLSQHLVPNIAMALKAARSMTPAAFVGVLTNSLMEFDWASPRHLPDLPVISPDPASKGSGGWIESAVLMTPRAGATEAGDSRPRALSSLFHPTPPEEEQAGPLYQRSKPFPLANRQGTTGAGIREYAWRWGEEPRLTSRDGVNYDCQFVWPPCENLFYATQYAAIQVTEERALEQRSEPCEGPLLNGIDLKATLRSAMRGKQRLYVKRSIRPTISQVKGEPLAVSYRPQLELQPTVFLFSSPGEAVQGDWDVLLAGNHLLYPELSPRGQRLCTTAGFGPGNRFIESFSYQEALPVPVTMQPWVDAICQLHGTLRFGNPCINFWQSAAWLEKGRFKSAPILAGSIGLSAILGLYQARHQLAIDPADWANALILMALPYAQVTHRVIVVGPPGWRMGEAVRREARRRGIEVFRLPLNHFPAARIQAIRTRYAVIAGAGGKEYPPELERILGQRDTTYADLLPLEIRRQARPRTPDQPGTQRTTSPGSPPGSPPGLSLPFRASSKLATGQPGWQQGGGAQ